MYKALLLLIWLSLVPVLGNSGCTPSRKPAIPPPELPPSTNRAPLPRNSAQTAKGLIGTAKQTPGIQQAWGIVHNTTLILGVNLEPWVEASNQKRIKLAAVARVLDATNQLIVIKITTEPGLVAEIKQINQAVDRGAKYSQYQEKIEQIDRAIPAIDQQRPR